MVQLPADFAVALADAPSLVFRSQVNPRLYFLVVRCGSGARGVIQAHLCRKVLGLRNEVVIAADELERKMNGGLLASDFLVRKLAAARQAKDPALAARADASTAYVSILTDTLAAKIPGFAMWACNLPQSRRSPRAAA